MASVSLLIKPAAGGIVHEGAGLHSGPAMGQEITQHQQEGFGGWGWLFPCAQMRFCKICHCMNAARVKGRLCLLGVCSEHRRVHLSD